MKSRLIQIAEGRIRVLLPEVVFSEDKLKGVVLPDRTTSMEFTVSSVNRVPMRLYFRSTNPRVTVSNEVSVREFGKISLEIDSKGLSIFDEIRGTVEALYNGGERSIPYVFTVGSRNGTSHRSFRSLEEFAAFSADHEEEAASLFSLKEFLLLPFMKDLHLQGLYRTFFNDRDPSFSLKEFLKAAGFEQKAAVKETETSLPEVKVRSFEPDTASRVKRMNYRLLSAFLQYEIALHKEEGVAEAGEKIEQLSVLYPESPLASLLLVYYLLQEQRMQEAKEILLKIQDVIQKNRTEEKAEYCLFLYLASIVQQDRERIENAGKLIRKYYEETPTSLLLSMLEYRVNSDPDREPVKAAEFLRQCWFRGLKFTPVLESTALLYRESETEPDALTEYELMSVIYGLRHDLISEQKLFHVLSRRELDHAKLLNLYLTVLKTGYLLFKNREFLLAVISVFLQKKYSGKQYFYWYAEAAEKNLSANGLYEGYMLSLPDSFSGPLPENLIRYFGLYKETSRIDLAFLYSNVLTEYAGRPDILDLYRVKISDFAVRSMKEERYALSMKEIYRTILKKEYLNEETAPSMHRLFQLYEVVSSVPDAKRIVFYYPEIDKEDIYPLEAFGKAMVPILSEEAIPAVENRKGERFHDENLRMERVFTDEELEKQCLLYTGGSFFMKLKEVNGIVKSGTLKESDLFMVTEVIKDRRISPFYKTRLYESVIDLALLPSMEHVDCTDFLAEADYLSFTRDYRLKLIEVFLKENRDVLAVERVMTYGMEGLSDEAVLKIAETAMTLPYLDGTDALLSCCYRLFSHDSATTRELEYLAKHFYGPVRDMLSILKALRRKKAASYDFAERTLTLGFFTGETKDLDTAFEYYLSEGGRFDVVEKAFLVLRSHEFVTERRKLSDLVVRELKKYVFSLPNVALIALTEQFALQMPAEDKDDRKLLNALLLKCVEKNIVLSCFSEFEKTGDLPFELENRVFVELRRPGARAVSIIGKTFPNQKMFHREMNEIYPGIFVQSFFLFNREWIEYSFLVRNRDESVSEAEGGVLSREEGSLSYGGRYEDLMMLEKKIRGNDMKEIADYLRKVLEKEAMIEDIFGK